MKPNVVFMLTDQWRLQLNVGDTLLTNMEQLTIGGD
jgi:hypothetical protein